MYSVVIAAREGDPFLRRAVNSVLHQSLPPERVEIVTDHGVQVSRIWRQEVEALDSRVSFFQQGGTGLASALCAGIRRVESSYVAFLDCDDRWLPGKQEDQIPLLEQDQNLDAVTCFAVNIRSGEGSSDPRPSCTFTATTFRTDAFARFGLPDSSAGHFVWLYRWWAAARAQGISTRRINLVGLERHIHGANSWLTHDAIAHRALLAELRAIVTRQRTSGTA